MELFGNKPKLELPLEQEAAACSLAHPTLRLPKITRGALLAP